MIKKILGLILTISFVFLSVNVVCADNISDLPVKAINGKEYFCYEVQRGETIFGLLKKFSLTEDELYKYNPSVKSGLKAFSNLYFPVDIFGKNKENTKLSNESTSYKKVTIKKGESLFGIAYDNGVTVDDILKANPTLDSSFYKAGDVILVPVATNEGSSTSNSTATYTTVKSPVQEVKEESSFEEPVVTNVDVQKVVDMTNSKGNELAKEISPEPQIEELPADTMSIERIEVIEVDTLNVTLMLPFESSSSNPSKTANLYTEFYKGFLLAAEELSKIGDPVKIRVVDTSVSPDTFDTLLKFPEIQECDLFIGPDNEEQLVKLAAMTNESGAYILNCFVIKDELLDNNPSIIQSNILRSDMYAGAIDHFIRMAHEATPVFVSRVDGEADKMQFIDQLKTRLEGERIPFKEIVYNGVMTEEDFSSLNPSKNYIFIPVSGSRNEFVKLTNGLKEYKLKSVVADGNVVLFGYPEWTTLRGDQQKSLGDLDAVIYSRFDLPQNYQSSILERKYKEWYGEEWSDVVPNQVLFGYDMAKYAISTLRKGNGDVNPELMPVYEGVQSSMHLFRDGENDGWVNQDLYFITFTPYGRIKSEVVTVPKISRLAQ